MTCAMHPSVNNHQLTGLLPPYPTNFSRQNPPVFNYQSQTGQVGPSPASAGQQIVPPNPQLNLTNHSRQSSSHISSSVLQFSNRPQTSSLRQGQISAQLPSHFSRPPSSGLGGNLGSSSARFPPRQGPSPRSSLASAVAGDVGAIYRSESERLGGHEHQIVNCSSVGRPTSLSSGPNSKSTSNHLELQFFRTPLAIAKSNQIKRSRADESNMKIVEKETISGRILPRGEKYLEFRLSLPAILSVEELRQCQLITGYDQISLSEGPFFRCLQQFHGWVEKKTGIVFIFLRSFRFF